MTMATITGIDAFSVRISSKTVWTFVRARDAEGRCGWGEGTLQGEAAAIHDHVKRLSPSLVGQAPEARMRSWSPASAPESAAIGAIDQALWDLDAQQRGKPLADLLGPPLRDHVPLYANINRGTLDRSPAGFAARALEVADRGFDAVKIAPLDDVSIHSAETPEGRRLLDAGVARVAAVRAALGPDRRLMVDCHWRLSEAAAADLLRELAPFDLYWFECPLAEVPAMFPALKRLRALAGNIGIRLAGCETMTGVAAFEAFLAAGVYDVVMPDVKYAGGLAEMLRIGDAAAACGVVCSPHNPTGPIAHLHSVHVSALLAGLPFLEFQYGESPLFFDLVDGALPDPTRGTSVVPRGAGLGAGIDMARLGPLLVQG